MGKKGLTKENIIEGAIKLVSEKGYKGFSLRELASTLDVKPASLYNHISGIEEINTEVGLFAIHELEDVLLRSIAGKNFRDALMDISMAYRKFAMDNYQLYETILQLPMSDDELLKGELHRVVKPFIMVLNLKVREENLVNRYQRMLRSTIHGFITLEASGFLKHCSEASGESFKIIIKDLIDIIE